MFRLQILFHIVSETQLANSSPLSGLILSVLVTKCLKKTVIFEKYSACALCIFNKIVPTGHQISLCI